MAGYIDAHWLPILMCNIFPNFGFKGANGIVNVVLVYVNDIWATFVGVSTSDHWLKATNDPRQETDTVWSTVHFI